MRISLEDLLLACSLAAIWAACVGAVLAGGVTW